MKDTYQNKIAYDFDGVLCDTMPAFIQYWQEKYSWTIWEHTTNTFNMPLPEDYDYSKIHGDIVEAVNLYQPYLQPYAFAMEMVREIAREYNEQPIIITARRPENVEVTRSWLKAYLGIPFTLISTGEKGKGSGENKPDVIAEHKIQYFVEDRFKTCNSIKSCDAIFMPDRPWNWDRTPLDHVIRVNNLLDVWDYIKREEEE
jgi:uncharacterized HAD superfamily protein